MAKMLFVSMMESIFKEMPSLKEDREVKRLTTHLSSSLDDILKSTSQYSPSIVGMVQVRFSSFYFS